MASLSIFCTRNELQEWLRLLCSERSLRWILYRAAHRTGIPGRASEDFRLYPDCYALFLCPSTQTLPRNLDMNVVPPRRSGWITIRPGAIMKRGGVRMLTFSEIHGEDCKEASTSPAREVRWLKARIKKVAKAGVIAGEANTLYRDIWFTSEARKLHASGVIWKQHVDYRSVFRPPDRL